MGSELAVVKIGGDLIRNYAWYISETQDQADTHLLSIADVLESKVVSTYYPLLSQRQIGKYGNSRGWRRERLWAANGFIIDAIGFDTARRGARIAEHRPGLMVFDDIDGKMDSPKIVKKKISILTSTLLPAGSEDLAVMFLQNMVHSNSIASQLAEDRADFLKDRVLSGPDPAVEDLHYEYNEERRRYIILKGTPTWKGQDLKVAEDQLNEWGPTAFKEEAQHDVKEQLGGVWNHIEFRYCSWSEVPDLIDITVWCDPSVTSTDGSDHNGVQADGLAVDGTIFRLFSWELRASPTETIRTAVLKALELKASTLGVETDQGGETWDSVYYEVCQKLIDDEDYPNICDEDWTDEDGETHEATDFPMFLSAKAGSVGSKMARNKLMLVDYEHYNVVHVLGTHGVLDRALKRFPIKPLDLADGAFWSWKYLKDLRSRTLLG